MANHVFGGDWTTDKLTRLQKYLSAYTKIFNSNPKASHFSTIYVDAFAGTGQHLKSKAESRRSKTQIQRLFESDYDADIASLQKGSASRALDVDPPFDQYVFVEQKAERIQQLEELRITYPHRAHSIRIAHDDANAFLARWCQQTDWRHHRAVVFLDPYGMQVEWATIQAIAATKAVDLWVLVPLGIAINRLVTRAKSPPEQWSQALTRLFGTDSWRTAFYAKRKTTTLFGESESEFRQTTQEKIGEFFLERLKSVFTAVSSNPLPLSNSKGTPIYLLCFAAGNPRGAKTAVKIANDILK